MANFWEGFPSIRGSSWGINEEEKLENRWVWYTSEKYFLGFLPFLPLIFIVSYCRYSENMAGYAYIKQNIQGIVIGVEVRNENNKARQYHVLKIKDDISKTTLEYWACKSCHTDTLLLVQVGDSVSKPSNSRTRSFFKLKNGVFEKFCECD